MAFISKTPVPPAKVDPARNADPETTEFRVSIPFLQTMIDSKLAHPEEVADYVQRRPNIVQAINKTGMGFRTFAEYDRARADAARNTATIGQWNRAHMTARAHLDRILAEIERQPETKLKRVIADIKNGVKGAQKRYNDLRNKQDMAMKRRRGR